MASRATKTISTSMVRRPRRNTDVAALLFERSSLKRSRRSARALPRISHHVNARIAATTAVPAFTAGENVRIEPLSVMRKKIAQHMVQSKQTSAHVTTVFEVDFTNIDRLRKQYKESYAERGVKRL